MSRHVLGMDDDPVVAAIAADFLKEAGYKVSTAGCGVYSNHIISERLPPT